MILDLVLLGTLIICIAYCIILTKRINDLNANKVNLNNMFDKFDESISKASDSLITLNKASETVIKNLSDLVNKGEALSNELSVVSDLGNNVAKRIENASNAAKAETQISTFAPSEDQITNKAIHENKLAYNINQVSSPQGSLNDKKTLDQTQYFSSLKKISTKNEI